MRILHIDSLGGASGDILLGALCALGVNPQSIEQRIETLGVSDFGITVEPFKSHAIQGVQAKVKVPHEHAHRHLSCIEKMINEADLPEGVKENAKAVFLKIAEAEAEVHGTTVEKIHFHEVGAMDSIIDIVGCCLALHELEIEQVVFRKLPLGQGAIQCAHGTILCPAPATLKILQGIEVEQTDQPFEMVTPTGAALLAHWRTGKTTPAGAVPVKSVFSFGQRELNERANVLRATIFETEEKSEAQSAILLQTNIDDATPELLGELMLKLEALALDVWHTPIQMKKQRQIGRASCRERVYAPV